MHRPARRAVTKVARRVSTRTRSLGRRSADTWIRTRPGALLTQWTTSGRRRLRFALPVVSPHPNSTHRPLRRHRPSEIRLPNPTARIPGPHRRAARPMRIRAAAASDRQAPKTSAARVRRPAPSSPTAMPPGYQRHRVSPDPPPPWIRASVAIRALTTRVFVPRDWRPDPGSVGSRDPDADRADVGIGRSQPRRVIDRSG